MSYYVPWASPKILTEYYTKMVDNYVDNVISTTNLADNLVIFYMENIQRLADSTKGTGGLELRMQRQLAGQ